MIKYLNKLTPHNIDLLSYRPQQKLTKKVLTRIQSVIQNEWAKNLSALEQQSFFRSARPCHTVYMLGLWLFSTPNILFCEGKQCRFCLFRLVFWVHSFDFWVMLMLQYSHLSPNVWGTSAWTTLKMRKENYSSWMCVDMYMKQKNIAQMQNSSWSSFYTWQHGWYGTLTIVLWVNFFPDQHWNICNVQMNEKSLQVFPVLSSTGARHNVEFDALLSLADKKIKL